MAELKNVTIDKFLGVNKTSTETLLQLGEASSMSNFLVTDDLKLSKMYGYVSTFATLGDHSINGMWYGSLSGTYHFLFSCNGHAYEHNISAGTNTDLGAIADHRTVFFMSNNTVYILDGTNYFKWTGTGSIAAVTGYIPTVYTASAPAGGGTILEPINYLIGTKIIKFSGDNAATVYQLPELSIDSIDMVTVNGVASVLGVGYTQNLTAGTITFDTEPPLGVNNVIVTWTKTTAGDRDMIVNNNFYGGVYFARFWLFGNPNYKNSRFPSGVTMAGVSDPAYFPKFSDSNVGEYEITDIAVQYDTQVIFTSGDSSGASAWYSNEEDYVDVTTGAITALFPVYPLNSKIGNVAKGQTQIINNNPYTVHKGIYEWVSTYIRSEKNAIWVSQKIQNDIADLDLTSALTVDWNEKGQYWFCIGKKVWVFNYRVNVWYILEFPDTPTCFVVAGNNLYIGTTAGEIMRLDEASMTYAGETITATWEMGFTHFGADWIRKFIQRVFLTILPLGKTQVDMTFETDLDNTSDTFTATYQLSSFADWDFAGTDTVPTRLGFSFATNYSPQPFKFKIRAKKFDYFKLKLKNHETYGCTILSITLPTRTGGEVKGV